MVFLNTTLFLLDLFFLSNIASNLHTIYWILTTICRQFVDNLIDIVDNLSTICWIMSTDCQHFLKVVDIFVDNLSIISSVFGSTFFKKCRPEHYMSTICRHFLLLLSSCRWSTFFKKCRQSTCSLKCRQVVDNIVDKLSTILSTKKKKCRLPLFVVT